MELDHEAGQTLMNEQNNVIQFDEAWKRKLELNQYGNVKRSVANIKLVFDNDEDLKDIGRINEFSGLKEIYNLPPWRKKDDDSLLWTDTDEALLRNYIALNYGIENQSGISDCMQEVFYRNSYHPIRDYLKGLQWDRTKRVDTIFIDFLGAEDSNYTRTITRKMLVAAVARVFDPGVKFDNALILLGDQGSGKSHTLSRLGGEWFNESINSFKGDDALMKLRNSWIIELAELSALKASEVEEVKGFISARVDTYRPKYGKNMVRFPRQCVFFGSTNNFEFLKDSTGNRRFLPLRVNKDKRSKNPFEELTDDYVNQIWAESYQLYKQGEQLFLEDEEVRNEAQRLQEEHTSDDGTKGVIEQYIKNQVAVCARQIWHECLGYERQPKRHEISDINQLLRSFEDWEETRERFGKYGQQRGFIKQI